MTTPALLSATARRTTSLHRWQGRDQVSTWSASTLREAAAHDVVQSDLGERLGQRLKVHTLTLRNDLQALGLTVICQRPPIVPVLLGSMALARGAAKLHDHGVMANQVEFRAVPEGQARFGFQVVAGHKPEQGRLAATGVFVALNMAKDAAEFETINTHAR